MKPPAEPLELPFTVESLEQVLADGASGNGKFTHYQIADWCLRMSNQFHDEDCADSFDRALSIACTVECQWDLYLVNSYPLAKLRELDPDSVSLPRDWFKEWHLDLTQTAN